MIINLQGNETEAKLYYARSLENALGLCQEEGCQALFVPQMAEARIKATLNSDIWEHWLSSPSIRATGRTRSGSAVVVYAHKDNHFSNPRNILEAKRKGLVNYAGIMPQDDFQGLVDSDGSADERGNRLVWVVDYYKLRSSTNGIMSVGKALEHPQTIPFLGGDEIAQRYLEKYKEVYGNRIGVWYSDDLDDEPLGRLLFFGDYYVSGLIGNKCFTDSGRFLGVRAPRGWTQNAAYARGEEGQSCSGIE